MSALDFRITLSDLSGVAPNLPDAFMATLIDAVIRAVPKGTSFLGFQ